MVAIEPEVVAVGVRFGEGPVWLAGQEVLLVTSVMDGMLHRIDSRTGRCESFADTSGGPNGLAPATAGVLLTQNGGIDFRRFGAGFEDAPAPRWTAPALVHVGLGGDETMLVGGHGLLRAPNDLVVARDGSVLFTDPPRPRLNGGRQGRVLRWSGLSTDAHSIDQASSMPGRLDVVAAGLTYPNGIGVDSSGTVVIVEQDGLMRLEPDGSARWFVRNLGEGGGDGLAFDLDDNCYVCAKRRGCVRVIDRDGLLVDVWEAPAPARLTNCCFGGPDLQTLYVTDAERHRVLAYGPTPVPGRPLTPFDSSLVGRTSSR